MAFSFVVLAPAALLQPMEVHRATLEKQWKGILYIGSFMALNIALNNISLLDISLSLNQIIRLVATGGRAGACGGGACPGPAWRAWADAARAWRAARVSQPEAQRCQVSSLRLPTAR
jgi:hypothetical protein